MTAQGKKVQLFGELLAAGLSYYCLLVTWASGFPDD